MANFDSISFSSPFGKENKDAPSLLNNRNTIGKFKEDIVNAVYQIEDKLANSTTHLENQFKSRSEVIDNRIILLEEQCSKLSKQIYDLTIRTEKVNETNQLERKNLELISFNEIRVNNLEKSLTSSLYKYDKIFMDNMVLPGQIGDFCRFKNVKECLDYVLTQVGLLNSFKDKISAEAKCIKEKSDNSVKQINLQVEQIKKSFISTVSFELYDEGVNTKFKNVNDSITQVQMENNKYAISLRECSQLLQKDLAKLREAKEAMESHNNHLLKDFNDKIISSIEHFSHIKGQFNKINRQFTELAEFIKDVRFKRNINSEVTKNDLRKLANSLLGDDPVNNVNMNTLNESAQLTEREPEVLSTENGTTLRVIKDSEPQRKSKFLMTSSSASPIHLTQSPESLLQFKKRKVPPKKVKKKKTVISAKPIYRLNKVEPKKSKSVEKQINLELDVSSIAKTHHKSPTELEGSNQFISKFNKAKLSKVLTKKQFKPRHEFINDDLIS